MDNVEFQIEIKESEDFEIISNFLYNEGLDPKEFKSKDNQSYLIKFGQVDSNEDLIKQISDCFECYKQTDIVTVGIVDVRIIIYRINTIPNIYDNDQITYLIADEKLNNRPKKKIQKKDPIDLESIHVKIGDKKVKFLIGADTETIEETNQKEYTPHIFPTKPNKYLRYGQRLGNKTFRTKEEALNEARLLAQSFFNKS
jgi:hypothetical protein